MPTNASTIQSVWQARRERYAHRDGVGRRIREVLSNRFDSTFKDVAPPGQEPLVANLIAAGARTMARRVAGKPRITAEPRRSYIEDNQARSIKHQSRLRDYAKKMRLGMTLKQACYWLVAHDLIALVLREGDNGLPVIECKDPLTAYPSNVWPHMPDTHDVLFANKLPAFQAAAIYPEVGKVLARQEDGSPAEVVLGEFFDDSGLTVCLLEPQVVVLDTKANARCFLGRGFSPDLDFHGQFDHVMPMLLAQAKMMTLAFDYMDRLVYSEDWIYGPDPEITSNGGNIARGPGAVNVIRNGQPAKLTNNMSQQFAPELDRIERYIRVGGEFPTQLSGEPVGNWTTGKGTESLLTQVDDNVEYWQEITADVLTRAFQAIPELAQRIESPGAEDFSTPDDVIVTVDFAGLTSPSDVVQELQLVGAGVESLTNVRRNYTNIEDAQETEAEIELEQLRKAMLQVVEQKVSQGIYNESDVAFIARERLDKRKSLEQVLTALDAKKAAEQAQQGAAAPSLGQLLGGAQPPTGAGLPGGTGPLPGIQSPPSAQPPVAQPA